MTGIRQGGITTNQEVAVTSAGVAGRRYVHIAL
jgi:hypothetical protein